MARYAGQLQAPAEVFDLWPRLLGPRANKVLTLFFCPIGGSFWCSVVTLITFTSRRSVYELDRQTKGHRTGSVTELDEIG